MKKERLGAFGTLLLVSIIWGVASPIIKNTLAYFSPSVFLTYRFFLSTLVALVFFSLFPKRLPTTFFEIKHTIIHSVTIVILGLGLLFLGFDKTDSLTGNLLAATGPIFSIILGALLLKEKISRHEMIGLAIALTGSALTVLTGDGANIAGFLGVAMIGNRLILLSRLFDSFGSVSAKKAFTHHVDPQALTHIAFVIGFLFYSVYTIATLGGMSPLVTVIIQAPVSAHLGVLYMALISGTLGYTLANTALKQIDLGEASIFMYLTVVWGAPLSVLWLHEPLTPQFIVGAALIAGGVLIAEWKKRKRKKK